MPADGAELARRRTDPADVCEGCGRRRAGTAHHRVKKSQGGRWAAANLLRLCGSGTTGCHGWAEAHPHAAQAAGWSLLGYEDPTARPALIYAAGLWRAWWLLLPSGDYAWQRDPNPGELAALPA